MSLFDIAAALITISVLFGYINNKLFKLPHTIGLVLMALIASLIVLAIDTTSPDLHISAFIADELTRLDFNRTLMQGMLSFMLFAGAMHVNFDAFKDRLLAIGVMAILGTVISTAIVGSSMWWLLNQFGLNVPFIWALVFGALISPTDPVAVLGLFKTVKVPATLEATMAGESLFNDGVGVVIFTAVIAIAMGAGEHGSNMSTLEIIHLFAREAIGGALLGFVLGFICYRALITIDEHNIVILLTLALVMGAYSLAIHLEASGPIAMVVAGLVIGKKGLPTVSDSTRAYLSGFWSVLDEILNSVLFLLIGMEVLVVAQRLDHLAVALIAIPVTLFARWASVFISLNLLSRRMTFAAGSVPILTWGGLRGGIAVALALSLPQNEYKESIITITYAIVIFSIIIQGLTVQPLVEKLMPSK